MKILKPNQRCYWCSYCSPKTNKALYRASGSFSTFACENHTSELQEYEKQHAINELHLTEADYQTWMKLK